MNPPPDDRNRRVAAYLRANILEGSGRRVGRFILLIDPDTPEPFLNYAVPEDGIEATGNDLAELIAAFDAADRRPRLEYLPDLAPGLLSKLEAVGFRTERETWLLTSDGTGPIPSAASPVELKSAESRDDLWRVSRVFQAAFMGPEPVEADLDRLRAIQERGGLVVLASSAELGEDLGAGILTAPIGGVAEIAGIGVRPDFQGRGVGTAVTAFLARTAADLGVDLPFLMSEPHNAAGVYRRAGLLPFARITHISRGGAEDLA